MPATVVTDPASPTSVPAAGVHLRRGPVNGRVDVGRCRGDLRW